MLDRWAARQMGLSCPLTREKVAAWQLARLGETVERARRTSKFYGARLPARPISSWEEFEALPFTTPEDLREHGGEMLCVPPDCIHRVVTLTTSGSTGRPKRVYFTSADQELTIDYFHHGMAEFVSPGERVMSLFPGESPGCLNDLLGRALERMDCPLTCFGYPTPERYDALLDAILAGGIQSLVGPARAVAGAAERSAVRGLDSALAGQVNSVLLAAAYVSAEHRAAIERLWHCQVNEHYGMTETGLAGAVGCREPGGYHVWESGLYYEIIHPATGRPVPEGERGEIVVTTLNREGMPFVRYRTGDMSRFLPGSCPCGSALRRLERVGERPAEKKFLRPEPVF